MPHRFQIAEPRAARHAGFPLNWPWRRRVANEFSLHRIFFSLRSGGRKLSTTSGRRNASSAGMSRSRQRQRKRSSVDDICPEATENPVRRISESGYWASVRLRTFQDEDVLAREADRHRLAALRRRGARIVESVEMDRALLEAQANAHDGPEERHLLDRALELVAAGTVAPHRHGLGPERHRARLACLGV